MELVLRASDGRFRPCHDEGTLRRLILEVARMARPREPGMLSQAEFDFWRFRSSWPDAPSASCICKRLGLAWREVVALALHAERDWARTIGKRRQVTPIDELSEDQIAQALRFADRRAEGRPLRPALYDAIRDAAVRDDRRRWMYGGLVGLMLPNSDQIRWAAGSWTRALEIAGLAPLPAQSRSQALAVVDVLDAYVEATGRLAPVSWVVDEWRCKRPEPVQQPVRSAESYIKALRRRREARGQTTPMVDSARSRHVELPVTGSSTPVGPRVRGWSWDVAVELLAQLLCKLPPGTRRLGQREMLRLVRGRSLPSPSTLPGIVKREQARREATGWDGQLTLEDLWDEAAKRAVVLRHDPCQARPDAGAILDRTVVMVRFAKQHGYLPLERELKPYAREQGWRLDRAQRPHDEYIAGAEQRLRAEHPDTRYPFHGQRRLDPEERKRRLDEGRAREAERRRRLERRAGRPRMKRGGQPGVPRRTAIAEFVQEQDAFPSSGLLVFWAHEIRGMSLAAEQRLHAQELALVGRARRRAGQPVPNRVLTMRDRDALRHATHPAPPIRKRRKTWPADACTDAVIEVLRKRPGWAPSITEWRDLTRGRPDLPSYSRLRKVAKETMELTFAEFMAEMAHRAAT